MGEGCGAKRKAFFGGLPVFLEGVEEVLEGKNEEDTTFRGALLTAPLEGDFLLGSASPDVGENAVADKFAGEVEGKTGVHGGFEEGGKNGALVNGVKRLL